MHKALCLLVLSGLGMPAVTAQEVATDSATVRRIAKAKKEVNYEMKNITGRIVDDATGEPMGGVRIQALGLESYSTLTEEDGSYKLDIPTFSDVIYVYAEGYNPLQVVVKEGKADGKLISTHFKNIYTDGTNITANRMIEVDETSGVSIDTDIQNHLAGDIYTINRNGVPGQGAYMQIRGVNSLNAGSQPMIILDGNIIDPQYDRTTLHEGFYNNLLASIDPEDIASVQVLKNGTALYGAKGANGVVIITTKRGKSQATKIGVRIYGGVELT
ncbi:MAG: TonB-dependent receptor plug domain-containing protein, partial [Bacteroidaceae bacterium]|nr:TonB-dependent receptor plug domain-containing protein [Bacteroidaceae bacterium]